MSPTTDRSLSTATSLFRRWRATRDRGDRIPPDLWAAACAAAREHGISRTSLALGLDYYALKRQVDGGSQPATPRSRPVPAAITPSAPAALSKPVPAFVELSVAGTAHASAVACTITIERSQVDSGSARLRIELPAITAADLATLVERWSHRP
jgi:hypothetical protein